MIRLEIFHNYKYLRGLEFTSMGLKRKIDMQEENN